jgi:FkbH-like protein
MPSLDASSSPAVVVAATFTADPLLPGLRLVLGEAGLTLELRAAPYNQVFQELLSPTGMFATNAAGVNVVLVRIEDFIRDLVDIEEARLVLGRVAPDLAKALGDYAAKSAVPIILALLPPSPRAAPAVVPAIEKATNAVLRRALDMPGITILTPHDIEIVAGEARYDGVSDELAHMPFTQEHYASIALAIARKVHALRVPAHKVLVLDCDQTLWRGVVGEDGVDGIAITPAFAAVQEFALRAQAQGVLVCLASRNAERDVLDVLEKRPDMILKPEHIVAHRINWEPKPANVASLARTLNLGLESFVFIDDNPVECAAMRAELPEVVTLQLPAEDDIPRFLANLWTFDRLSVTEEDGRRTAMYRENALRDQSERAATDMAAFIASLDLEVDTGPPAADEWARLAQLTQRTNQFNFRPTRRSEPEMRGLARRGAEVLRVRVRDRFGDYGLVGLVVADAVGEALVVDTFLLSCRVLARGVEHTILRRLAELAAERRLVRIDLTYIPTARNEPARAFIDSVASTFRSEGETGEIVYRIPIERASQLHYRPGQQPAALIAAARSDRTERYPAARTVGGNFRSDRYARLAGTLASGASVVTALRSQGSRMRRAAGEARAPATKNERELLALWERLLAVEGIGVEDEYFDLGGTSLTAVHLFSEVARRFGVTLPLTAILERPTVRQLASLLDREGSAPSGGLVELRSGGPRNLFFVHDGDGETLLYRNLARRLPGEFGVFGIGPRGLPRVPLPHSTIEEMARAYIGELRERQAHGPYHLGGMCAGGVIAYEMAVQLERQGETVDLVALLDAAAPAAAKRQGRVAKERVERLRRALDGAAVRERPLVRRGLTMASVLLRKAANALAWELGDRLRRLSAGVRYGILRMVVARRTAWPRFVPALGVRDIYDSAEARYSPGRLSAAPVILLRAGNGEGADTPYRKIYASDALGWEAIVPGVKVIDVAGGHSSMLQEPYVEDTAKALTFHLLRHSPAESSPASARRLEPA